tara:strand:- start:8351 stop:8668 length:318 start_codon:yes stop_codon:yes gene_type:complete
LANNRAVTVFTISIIFFILTTTLAYYKENGIRTMLDLSTEIENINYEITMLKLENRKIEMERMSLYQKGLHVEAMAREDLGLVKKGEVVYEFIETNGLVNTNQRK